MYQSVLLDTDSTETYSMKLFMAPLGLQDTKTIFFRNGEFLNALMTCGSEIWANFSLNHWICLINDIQSELCKKPSFWLDYVDNEKSPQIQIYFTQYLNWYTCYVYQHIYISTQAEKLKQHLTSWLIQYCIAFHVSVTDYFWRHVSVHGSQDAIFCHMTTYGGQPWAGRRWPLHHVMWLTSWSVWLCPPLYSSGTSHWWCLQL